MFANGLADVCAWILLHTAGRCMCVSEQWACRRMCISEQRTCVLQRFRIGVFGTCRRVHGCSHATLMHQDTCKHSISLNHTHPHLTCKRGSVGQSEGLLIPRSSVRFRLNPENSNSHEFELHRPSIKGTKLLLKM